ncbi:MAG TPA: MnhB domain-containing protein, partial [Gaiellaceae bacterium]|nr:MnhB domain-containing protein [Gaiellaceae bacterium]
MTRTAARLLLAPTFVIALAILVKGYGDVGDGFNAGVVAALGVLMQYLAFGYHEAERLLPVRLASAGAIAGLLLALVVAFAPLVWGDPPLTHLPAPGADAVRLGTLELITAVVFDVGVFLLVFGAVVGIIRTIA